VPLVSGVPARLASVLTHTAPPPSRRGKHMPTFTPSMDMGGYVVVINAEQVLVTGNKFNQKLYRRHTTGRPGSMKVETFKDLQAVRAPKPLSRGPNIPCLQLAVVRQQPGHTGANAAPDCCRGYASSCMHSRLAATLAHQQDD
jgi:Ribosomal protein L13